MDPWNLLKFSYPVRYQTQDFSRTDLVTTKLRGDDKSIRNTWVIISSREICPMTLTNVSRSSSDKVNVQHQLFGKEMNPGGQEPGAVMVPPTLWQANVSRCPLWVRWGKFATFWHWLLNDRNKLSLFGQFLISASPGEQALWQKSASPWQPWTGRLRSGWTRRMCLFPCLRCCLSGGQGSPGLFAGGDRSLISFPVNLLLYSKLNQ